MRLATESRMRDDYFAEWFSALLPEQVEAMLDNALPLYITEQTNGVQDTVDGLLGDYYNSILKHPEFQRWRNDYFAEWFSTLSLEQVEAILDNTLPSYITKQTSDVQDTVDGLLRDHYSSIPKHPEFQRWRDDYFAEWLSALLPEQVEAILDNALPSHLTEQTNGVQDTGDGLLRDYYDDIFKYPEFQRWLDDPPSWQQLWLEGKPGVGKSTLMLHSVSGLRASREEDLWAATYSSINPRAEKNARKVSSFSSASRQYFVEGYVNSTPVEALPDSGADMCFISPKLASGLGLDPAAGTQRSINLANKKDVPSPGMVEVPWRFATEQTTHILNCWILPGCAHDIVLGNHFLRVTQTLTTFKNRIKSKLVELPMRLRLRLLGEEKQRLWGSLDGHLTAALPDTGSDAMLISGAYARKIGLTTDWDFANSLEVEFADGTTDWTSGVVRDVPWSVGGKTVRCNFHVLEDLCVDVILSKNYLFDLNVFSELGEYLCDANSEEDSKFCNIRLIGRYGDNLNILEEEYLEDVTSPSAFGPEMVQRELARRDKIRDEILALPENKQEAATQAEAERQRQWQDLKQTHRARWRTASSVSQSSNGHSNTHRTGTHRNRTRAASDGHPIEDLAEDGLQGPVTRRELWKKKVRMISVSLKCLRRGARA